MAGPFLDVEPTLARLPDGLPERIDAVTGPNRRAERIREATMAEPARRETDGTKPSATAQNEDGAEPVTTDTPA